jgi:hypothetical protein
MQSNRHALPLTWSITGESFIQLNEPGFQGMTQRRQELAMKLGATTGRGDRRDEEKGKVSAIGQAEAGAALP